MNILLIPNNDWVNHPVPAQRHYRIFESLGRLHNVYVLQFDLFHKHPLATHTPVFTHLVRPFTIHLSDPAQFYAVNIPFQGTCVAKSLRALSIDVVFGSHLAVCTFAFVISKLRKVKTVFDISDFFPDSVVSYYPGASEYAAKSMYSVALFLMKRNIDFADLCTACSSSLAKYAKTISPNSRVEQVPNGVDTAVFAPRGPSTDLRRKLGLRENTLIYVGSVESWLDFDTVIKGLAILRDRGTLVDMLIVGRNIYEASGKLSISELIERYELTDQIKLVGYQPYETVPSFTNLSVAGVIPFRTDSVLTQMAFPNKLLEYFACGKPVLAPPLPELLRVGSKYIFSYTNPREFAAQVDSILSMKLKGEDIRKISLDYDWNRITERLDRTLKDLVESG